MNPVHDSCLLGGNLRQTLLALDETQYDSAIQLLQAAKAGEGAALDLLTNEMRSGMRRARTLWYDNQMGSRKWQLLEQEAGEFFPSLEVTHLHWIRNDVP